VQTFTGTSWQGSFVDQALAPLDDLHLRRAVAFALDRAAMSQAVTLGAAPVALGPITPASWAYNPKLKGLDFNLTSAKQELAQSKYASGTKFEAVTLSDPMSHQIGELWKDLLTKINVDLTVTPLSVAEAQDRQHVKRDVPLDLSSFSLRTDPDGIVSDTLSKQGYWNDGHLDNPQLDDLILKARQTYDQGQRQALYDQIQQIAIDQVYQFYLYYNVAYAGGAAKIGNFDSIFGAEGKQRYKTLWFS